MAAGEAPIGPVCSICEEYEAIGSLMNLADYTTVRFCASCGPDYLKSITDALSGADTTPDDEPSDADPYETSAGSEPASQSQAEADAEAAREAEADGLAFPGTANVVKSTHGHRGGRKEGTGDA